MAILRGVPNEKGWRPLVRAPDSSHFGEIFPRKSEPLLVLHHLSDLHVCDTQSPLRPEFLDRWADPDSPIRAAVGIIGTYRPQSILTTQVVEAMILALNKVSHGPLSGHPIDGAIVTGDVTDNAQKNEVDWFINLLDGGMVTPDSGASDLYEGVMDDKVNHYDPKYWHPHGTPADCEDNEPRAKYGYPVIPGLLNSARASFQATGLNVPWYAVNGNHDALLQGTVAPTEATQILQVGGRRYEGLPTSLTLEQTLIAFNRIGPANYPDPGDAPYVEVTPDLNRRAVEKGEFIQKHLNALGMPEGHGFEESNAASNVAYYARDVAGVRLIVLDSVNPFGGWHGSLDRAQFEWLELNIASSTRPVVLASHHPLSTMINGYSSDVPRICTDELRAMLLKYPQVILWLAGHEHRNHVEWVGENDKNIGFWHIETASHIDWPQQSRTIEVAKDAEDNIFIGLTVVDHAGDLKYKGEGTPVDLAALSRLLSANDWQYRAELVGRDGFAALQGSPEEGNVVLQIKKR